MLIEVQFITENTIEKRTGGEMKVFLLVMLVAIVTRGMSGIVVLLLPELARYEGMMWVIFSMTIFLIVGITMYIRSLRREKSGLSRAETALKMLAPQNEEAQQKPRS